MRWIRKKFFSLPSSTLLFILKSSEDQRGISNRHWNFRPKFLPKNLNSQSQTLISRAYNDSRLKEISGIVASSKTSLQKIVGYLWPQGLSTFTYYLNPSINSSIVQGTKFSLVLAQPILLIPC